MSKYDVLLNMGKDKNVSNEQPQMQQPQMQQPQVQQINEQSQVQQPMQGMPNVIQEPMQGMPNVIQEPMQGIPSQMQQTIQQPTQQQMQSVPNIIQEPMQGIPSQIQQAMKQTQQFQQPIQEVPSQVYQEPMQQFAQQPMSQLNHPTYQEPPTELRVINIEGRKALINGDGVIVQYITEKPALQHTYNTQHYVKPSLGVLGEVGRDLSSDEIVQHLVETGIVPINSEIQVYQPHHLNVAPLEFDIKDTTGRIAQKVESIEKETGLSTIPFKLACINKFVTEIMGYYIYTDSNGEKFACSTEHIVSNNKIESKIREWKDKLSVGEIVNESIMEDYTDGTNTYNICMFNKFELDHIATLLQKVGIVFYTTKSGETRVTIGV